MYNLTVDQAHTFYVGDQEWLVHNTCPIQLPEYSGGKTRGILDTGKELINLISGRNGPAAQMPANTPGMTSKMVIRDHVEAHAAAIMRQQGLSEATLYINKVPCAGPMGCNANLPHMLPENAQLSVYIKSGASWTLYDVYIGVSDLLWLR